MARSSFVRLVVWAVAAVAAMVAIVDATVPGVTLKNAADPGTVMPAMGLGTGGYGSDFRTKYAYTASKAWLSVGGRRFDTALGYGDQTMIATAIGESKVSRSELWITSKMILQGYNATYTQFGTILAQLNNNTGVNTDYVDLLLLHYPKQSGEDPACQEPTGTSCRKESWRAMLELWKAGKARAVGVSNFEPSHLKELLELNSTMGWELPAVNQIEFNPYWHEDQYGEVNADCNDNPSSQSESIIASERRDLLGLCQLNGITFNGYSPLGGPDVAPARNGWNSTIITLPMLQMLGKKYGKTAAQVVLRWQWQQGIVLNPRTHNVTHMQENLNIFDFELSAEDMYSISNDIPIPQAPCPTPVDHCCHKVCSDYFAVP